MAAGGHFGWQKITFNRITRHFRSIRNFFFHNMAAGGHFGWPKINFNLTTRHFRSICNFFFDFFFQNDRKSLLIALLAISDQYATFCVIWAILDDRKWLSIAFQINTQFYSWLFFSQNGCRRPFWMTENHFRSHFSQFQINTFFLFCSQNGCRRPFWMTENLFRSNFSPYQMNTKLFFFTKWLQAAILDNRKSILMALLAISDQLFFFQFFFSKWVICIQNGHQRPFCFSDWCLRS